MRGEEMLGLLTTSDGLGLPKLLLYLVIGVGVFSAVWFLMKGRTAVSNRQALKAQLIDKWSDESPLYVLRFRTGDGRVWEYKVDQTEYDRFELDQIGRLETDGPEYKGFVPDPNVR